ncbi:MAG TPA: hypothetical protein VHZ24_18495, partial [Pirellulales bacterium]|nr:hypothetical protein [Pirellulales bacterium]
MNHLCVIGFPSKVGGADTELDHQIHCWQALGLQVHLIHTAPLDANLQAMRMEDRGCVIHEPRDWQAAEDDAASAAGDLCLMAGTWYGGTIRFYRDNTLKNIVTITNADIT